MESFGGAAALALAVSGHYWNWAAGAGRNNQAALRSVSRAVLAGEDGEVGSFGPGQLLMWKDEVSRGQGTRVCLEATHLS